MTTNTIHGTLTASWEMIADTACQRALLSIPLHIPRARLYEVIAVREAFSRATKGVALRSRPIHHQQPDRLEALLSKLVACQIPESPSAYTVRCRGEMLRRDSPFVYSGEAASARRPHGFLTDSGLFQNVLPLLASV
jgi:hypothetical protein